MALTTVDNGLLSADSQYTGFKNRIINGAMVIDQRNAGASVSVNNTSGFGCDRWQARIVGGGIVSLQQSSTAPVGFINTQSLTVTTADSSVASTDDYKVGQFIEGLNVADLGWGTANAQTVTLSFWVRSSLTGTYCVSLQNSAENRSYPATYVINSANTLEYKTISIAGDTSGTWLTTNGIGVRLNWNLGSGSSYNGTANAWNAADSRTVSGAVNWIGTNGATFYITGVQLEKGSTATSFDYRPYGTELSLCQRYLPAIPLSPQYNGAGQWFGATVGNVQLPLPVTARVAPTGYTLTANSLRLTNASGGAASGTVHFYGVASTNFITFESSDSAGNTTGYATMIYPTGALTILPTGCEL